MLLQYMPVPELVVQDPLALSQPTKFYIIDCMGVGPSIKIQEFKRFHLQLLVLFLHLSQDKFKRFAALFVFIIQYKRLRSSTFWVKLEVFVAAVINLTAAHISESNNCSMHCQKWQRVGFQ